MCTRERSQHCQHVRHQLLGKHSDHAGHTARERVLPSIPRYVTLIHTVYYTHYSLARQRAEALLVRGRLGLCAGLRDHSVHGSLGVLDLSREIPAG